MLNLKKATLFIVLIGIVSLFADMTYEGARSITGQYLAILGASGAVVGTVSGLGELIGYCFRLVSGYISDRTRQYWLLTIIGFAINLLAVPCLALAGNWQLAATFIILERFGKSLRTPPRDTMLSFATHEIGRGWGFGLHEAMDKTGAILGPLFISLVLFFQGGYRMSFALLLLPAICALTALGIAKYLYPHPRQFEIEIGESKETLSKKYWIYLVAIGLVAAGYVDFPLIAYHFKRTELFPDAAMPVLFSVAMSSTIMSSLAFGRLFDLKGFSILIYSTFIASFAAFFAFSLNGPLAILGMILWGIGLGAQESIMRAAVATFVHANKRGTAYGIMNAWFGVFWFLGSALMGFLYDISILGLVVFSFVSQLAAIPLFLLLRKQK